MKRITTTKKRIMNSKKWMNISFFILLFSFFSFFAACNSDDSAPEVDAPIQFTAGIVGQEAIQTRAAGTTWAANDAIGVFMKKAGENFLQSQEKNRKYSTTGGSAFTLNDGGQPIYYLQLSNADFIAYYPYQTSITSSYIYKVKVNDQSKPEKIDLLYATKTNVGKSQTTVTLQFAHQLSQIALTVVKGTAVTDAEVQNMTVAFEGMPTTADFNLADGTFVNLSGVANISLGNIRTAIIIPHAANSYKGRKMLFTVNGQTFAYTLPDGDALASGSKYNYTITINRTGVTVTKGEITNWEKDIISHRYTIGDYYPDDENPIGVVYTTSNGGKNGKIVSLDEPPTKLMWSTEFKLLEASDEYDGRVNMKKVASQTNWQSKYPAFEWVHRKNPASTNYDDVNATGIWYLPAHQELFALYFMKQVINNKLSTSGTIFPNEEISIYWSSSESTLKSGGKSINLYNGLRLGYEKNLFWRVRCILAF